MDRIASDAARHREVVLTRSAEGSPLLHLKVVTDAELVGQLPRPYRLTARLPVRTAEGTEVRDFPLQRVGELGSVREHVGLVDVEDSRIDLEEVRSTGAWFAFDSAQGFDCVWLQKWGDNVPLTEAAPLDEMGVAWRGPTRAWLLEGRRMTPLALDVTEAIPMSAARLAAGDDVVVELEVYAPGVTTKGVHSESTKQKTVRSLGLGVEGGLIKRGRAALRYRGQSGPALNNFRVGWSLSGPENKTGSRTKAGTYALRFLLGEEQLGALSVRWER
jgi:hypothetical protein